MGGTLTMNKKILRFGVSFILVAFAAAFASQIAVTLGDARFDERINHVAPIFGVAIAIVLVGGYRYLPAIFLGTVIPEALAGANLFDIISAPVAAVVAATLVRRALLQFQVDPAMERARDAFLILFWGAVVGSLFGSLVQSVFLCTGPHAIPWEEFGSLLLSNWLSAGVGVIIVTPFILTWATPVSFTLVTRQLFEVALWFLTLISFGHVTFQNWAPTDTLLYPMELAIFPIMAWAAFRFGLRGASAGVLALALLAAWELIPVITGTSNMMSQSPANIWVFVGIVSITSVCLAAVMTELRKREAQIAENESRLRAFTEALPDIAFVLGADGSIHDVFAATEAICANHRIVNAESTKGKQISEIFEQSACEAFLRAIRSALEDEKVSTFEYSLQSVDVGEHWFEARITPMLSSQGHSDRVVWVAYDISSRKASEAAIRQRDSILRATAQANNSLLTMSNFDDAVDAALFEIGKALKVDRAFIFQVSGSASGNFHDFGIQHECLLKESCPSLMKKPSFKNAPFEEFCPDWYERMIAFGLVQIDSGNCTAQEAETLNLLHSRAVLAIPMWKEGRLSGFFGVDHCLKPHDWVESEISAVSVLATGLSGLLLIREHENELRGAKDAADAASVAKGEFLAMMSHEIRTPMNAVIGYTDLLMQSELTESQSEHAAIIKRSGRALLDLINNILDYSKIESRSLELETKPFDLEQIICEALESVLPQANDKQLTVDYGINSSVSEFYLGDAHRLRQVLINLANNAIKFTETGSVAIKVSLQESDMQSGSDVLHFEVIDTGFGIPKDKIDRLFQPFSQVDSSRTRQFGGTGLGLVISKRLVERMDGNIWVESQPGTGSNFQFHLRLKHASVENKMDENCSEGGDENLGSDFSDQHPLRILLCEDDKDNRLVICKLLESLGYRPDVVESAEEALIRLQSHAYDVVLMDIRLPGRSGIELTRAIRSGEELVEFHDQYIVAVTALAMNEDREQCLNAGMNDYIRKPIEITDLKDALRRAYSHSLG